MQLHVHITMVQHMLNWFVRKLSRIPIVGWLSFLFLSAHTEAKTQAVAATSAAEVAEARLKSTQEQLHKANDAAAEAQDKVYQLQATVEVGSATGSIHNLGLIPQNP